MEEKNMEHNFSKTKPTIEIIQENFRLLKRIKILKNKAESLKRGGTKK